MSHSEANDTVVVTVSPRDRLQVRRDLAVERLALGREDERAVLAREQRDAERLLDRGDLPRQRGLGEVQLLRGPRERLEPPRGLEAAQKVERRQPAQGLMHDL